MQRSLPTPKYYIMFVFMRLFMHQESLYRHLVPTKHTHTHSHAIIRGRTLAWINSHIAPTAAHVPMENNTARAWLSLEWWITNMLAVHAAAALANPYVCVCVPVWWMCVRRRRRQQWRCSITTHVQRGTRTRLWHYNNTRTCRTRSL